MLGEMDFSRGVDGMNGPVVLRAVIGVLTVALLAFGAALAS